MDFKQACSEAYVLATILEPYTRGYKTDKESMALINLMLSDLAVIAAVVGAASDGFSKSEKEAAAVVGWAVVPGTADTFKSILVNWDSMNRVRRLHVEWGMEEASLTLLQLIEHVQDAADHRLKLAERPRDATFDTIAAAYYRFAQYVAKCDGAISHAEEAALRRVHLMIYDPPKATSATADANRAATGQPGLGSAQDETPAKAGIDEKRGEDGSDSEFDVELAAREGVAMGEAVWPFLGVIPSDQLLKVQNALAADLVTIATVVGAASGGLSKGEKLAAALAVSAIGTRDVMDTFKTLAENWELTPAALRQQTKQVLITKIAGAFLPDFGRAELAASRRLFLTWLRRGKEVAVLDAIAHAYYRYAQFVAKSDGTVSPAEEATLKRVWQMIYAPDEATPTEKPAPIVGEPAVALEDVLKQLDSLVGMDNVKEAVRALINYLKVQKERRDRNMLQTPISLHAVFRGPPGTGKTTVARLLGAIYRNMGFLKKGHVIETDRAGLVAGYIGQTSGKVDKLVTDALDGVLFIDEAYALMPADSTNDYGQEALDILLKRMEDYRDRLVVIVAGYPDEMSRFLEGNPGVKSRFNRYFDFIDYAPTQLVEIFRGFCKGSNFTIGHGGEDKLREVFEVLYSARDRTFGNGRLARNIFERTVERQANRIAGLVPLTDELLSTLEAVDIPPDCR